MPTSSQRTHQYFPRGRHSWVVSPVAPLPSWTASCDTASRVTPRDHTASFARNWRGESLRYRDAFPVVRGPRVIPAEISVTRSGGRRVGPPHRPQDSRVV